MKLYDTINGDYISESEVEKTLIIQQVYAGEFDEHQLENWTIEGSEVGDSTKLADLKNLGYAYISGVSGTVIACSDGRHVDTVWCNGCWDEGGDTAERDVWADRLESLKKEMDLRETDFEESDSTDTAYHVGHGKALEFALNCVNDEITELYPDAMRTNADFSDMEYCIMDYVGDHIGWHPKSTQLFGNGENKE